MGKKLRKLYRVVRKPLVWALTVMMITQLFPAQSIAYALDDLSNVTPIEEQAPEQEIPTIVEASAEPANEAAPVNDEAADPVGEPATEPVVAPTDEPAVEPADEPATEPAKTDEAVSPDSTPTSTKAPILREVEMLRDGEGDGDDIENKWEVRFRNRDGEVIETKYVDKNAAGTAIGTLPDTIDREDYIAYWAIGTASEGGQGTVWTPGQRIDETFLVTEDLDIIPDYDKQTYTITFYTDETCTEVLEAKDVDVDTNYSLNAIPTVPMVTGYSGKWVYSGGDFNNDVHVSADTAVWPEYTKNTFTVTFVVNGETYQTDPYYYGDDLALPADPVVTGKEFAGWFAGDMQYVGGEDVESDLTIVARLTDMYQVDFVVKEGDTTNTVLTQYYRTSGDQAVGTLPQDPFSSGKIFDKWVIEGTDTEVTEETVVTGSFTAEAVFRTIDIYNIRAEYYYLNQNGQEVVFNVDTLQVEVSELPYIITAPASTETSGSEVPGAPIYYPENPTVTLTQSDFDSDNFTLVRFKYVDHTATYDFVYMLKDLEGDGYTEIPGSRESNVNGVLGSTVTPTIKNFDYAVLESADSTVITQESGQEVCVYYTRKNYSLSYETNGGSYVGGGTYAYGSTVNLPTSNPTRTGYTFAGWYSDEDLTERVTGSVTINGDTILYAKWNGATVNYTIIYMKEVYNNSTGMFEWEYENSYDTTGTVGTTVYAATARKLPTTPNGYELSNAMNGTATSAGEGEDSAVEIKADGSTVLKVYYSLIRYTLTFAHRVNYDNYNYNNATLTQGTTTYTNNQYSISGVVIGQDISALWPTDVNSGRQNYSFTGWRYTNASGGTTTRVTKMTELTYEMVARADANHVMTYSARYQSGTTSYKVQYWLQQPDGTYVVDENLSQSYSSSGGSLSAKDIAGYSLHNNDGSTPGGNYPASGNVSEPVTIPAYQDTYTDDGGHRSANPAANERTVTRIVDGISVTYTFDHAESYYQGWSIRYRYVYIGTVPEHTVQQDVYVYNFYYDRASNDIVYYYVNKNSQRVEITTIEDVLFEKDITGSTYNFTPQRPAELDSDYTFGGWYADAALTQAYTFATMPDHTLELYAKWVAPSYTVSFVDDDASTQLAESQTVEKYKRAEKPATNPTKRGYTFDGWFTSLNGNTLFDWNTPITADTTIYAHWTHTTLTYTVHYVDEDGNKVAADKIETNPNLSIGQTVTEQAIAVAGYRPTENSKSIVMAEDGNEITFVYKEKEEETSYTVKYILDPTEFGENAEIALAKNVSGISGNTASVIEYAAAVDYDSLYAAYPELEGSLVYPDAAEKQFVLTASAETNVFYFIYSPLKNAHITVNFVDMSGAPIASADTTQTVKVGGTYALARTPIAGWEFVKAVEGTNYNGTEAGTNYTITEADANNGLTFTLFYQRKATITVVSKSKQYEANSPLTLDPELNNQVIVEGLLDGDSLASIDYTYNNADYDNVGRLNAGVATVTPKDATISGTHASTSNYYSFRYISGTLEVTKINVTIRIEPDRWTGNVYDGDVKETGFTNPNKGIEDYVIISHEGYKDEYLDDVWAAVASKAEYDATAAGLGYIGIAESDAGDYTYFENVLTVADLPDDPNFNVSIYIRPGRLEIKPAPLTITTGSDTKVYDGTPLTCDETTITGLIGDETATVVATGSRADVGVSENTYVVEWGTAKASNYDITETLGTLEVTAATLTLAVNNATKTYNGSEQEGYALPTSITGTGEDISETEYTVTGLAEGDVLSIDYLPATGTDAGTYTNGTFGDEVVWSVKRGDEDVTDNYTLGTTTAGTLTIDPAALAVTVKGNEAEFTYDGTEKKASGYTVTSELPEGVSVTWNFTTMLQVEAIDAGTYYMPLSADKFALDGENAGNYTPTFTVEGPVTLVIKKAPLTITAVAKEYVYNGSAQGPEGTYTENIDTYVTVDGLAATDTLSSITITGKKTDVGVYEDEIVASAAAVTFGHETDKAITDNYDVTYETADLTITTLELTITITGKNDTKDYDGTEHSVSGFTATCNSDLFDASLVSYDGEAVAARTDKGTTNMGLDADKFSYGNTNITATFVLAADGYMKVEPKAVTITANDASQTYNGSALTEDGFSVDSQASTDTHEFTVVMTEDSTITNYGTQPNVIATVDGTKVSADEPTEIGNYLVTVVPGTLTINRKAVTIKANDATKVYDGTALTEGGFTLVTPLETGDTHEFTVVMTGDSTITNPGTQPNVIATVDGVAVTTDTPTEVGNYLVTAVNGELEITEVAATITITSATKSWTYDGQTHTEEVYTVKYNDLTLEAGTDGKTFELPSGGTLVITPTAEGVKDVSDTASGNNTFTYVINHGTVDATSYYTNVATGFGTLSIDPLAVTVTITGHKDSKTYNGSEQKVEGYDVAISDSLYTENDFTFDGDATAKGTDFGTYPMGLAQSQFTNDNNNFDVTFNVTDGELKITKKAITVTINGNTDSKTYNGEEQEVTGYTVSIPESRPAYSESSISFSGDATAKGTTVGTYEMGLTERNFSNTDTNFDVTFVVNDGSLEITQKTITVTITGHKDSKTYNGEEQKVEGYDVEISDSLYKESDFSFSGEAIAKGTDYGTYPMGLAQSQFTNDNDNFDVTFNVTDGELKITKLAITVTINGNTKTRTYDGTEYTADSYELAFDESTGYTLNDIAVTGTTSVSGTNAGTYNAGITEDQFSNTNDNYDVTFTVASDVVLQINKRSVTVTITGHKDSKVYNGQEQKVEGYEVSIADTLYKTSDFTFDGDATAKGTDVGTYEMGLKDTDFTNNNANFDVTFSVTDGSLEITKLAVTVTITGNKDSKVYNGEEQKVEGYDVSISNSLYKESDFTFSGNDTAKGTDVGTYPMNLAQSQFTNTNDNFDVTFSVTDGELEITKLAVTVTITGNTDSKTYNGQEQKVEGYDVEISNSLYKESDFTFSGTAVAKGTNVGTYYMNLVNGQFTNNNDNFDVTFSVTDGSLEITKKAITVTITGAKDSKVYNGQEQSIEGYSVSISDPLYTEADFSFNGTKVAKGTNVGTYPMGLAQSQFTNNNANFDVTFSVTDGELEITKLAVTVTITGNTATKTYNAAEQSVEGYEVSISNPLYTENDFTFSGEAIAKGTTVGDYNMGLAEDQFTNNNGNFDVTFSITDGKLTITNATMVINIVGHKGEYTYNGVLKSVEGYDATSESTLFDASKIVFTGSALVEKTNAGTYEMGLDASQFSYNDPNFSGVQFVVTDGELVINKAKVTVTITGNTDSKTYNGEEQKVEGYEVGINNTLYTEEDFTYSGEAVAKGTLVGTYAMGLKDTDFTNTNDNFDVTFSVTDGELEITKLAVTVTITGNTDSKTYNGSEQKVEGYEVSISDPLYKQTDFTFSGNAVAKGTEVGTYEMGLAQSQFANNNGNFTVTFDVTDGELEITKLAVTVTITGHTDSKTYNATEQSVEGYDVQISNSLYKESDFTFSGTAVAKGTEVGTYKMDLAENQFTNNNKNFDVTFSVTDGKLTITNKTMTITVTGNNDTKAYNGAEQQVEGYTLSCNDPLYDESLVSFGGTAVAKGTNASTDKYMMGLAADQFSYGNDNITVTFDVTDGWLLINKVDLTITAESQTYTYNGSAQGPAGTYTEGFDSYVSVTGLKGNDALTSITLSGSETNVGVYEDEIVPSAAEVKSGDQDMTDNYNINYVANTLEITKLAVTVTITGNTGSKTYNGSEQKVTGYDVSISNNLYKESDFTYGGDATAKGTNVGTYEMGLKDTDFTNNNGNFDVTFNVTDGSLEITKLAVTVTITGNTDTKTYNGEEQKVEDYTVSYSDPLYTANDFTFSGEAIAKGTDVGTYTMGLTEDQFTNNNDNFDVTFSVTDGSLEITKLAVTVTITGHFNSTTYDSQKHTVEGYDVAYSNSLYTANDFTFTGEATASRTDQGTTYMGLTEDQFTNNNDNFDVTFNVTDGYQTIVPVGEVVVTITGHFNTTDYDGQEHSVSGYDVQISDPLYTEADFNFTGNANAGGVNAGTYNMNLAENQFTNMNENFAKVTFNVTDGYQTINQIDATVTIVGNTDTQKYNGSEQSVTGYEVTSISTDLYTKDDFTFSGDATAKGTDYGTYAMGLADTDFANQNPNFKTVTFNVTDGSLTITKRSVTLTSATDSKTYDGQPLTNSNVTVTGDGFVSGEGATYDVTGTQTETGISSNSFTYTLSAGTKAENYDITTVEGTLTVNAVTDKVTVTITEHSDNTPIYDGQEHSVTGYDVTSISNSLYTESDFTFSGDATVKGTNAGTYNMELKPADFTNISKNFTNVEFVIVDGTLVIAKRTVTLTSDSGSKTYDGKPLTAPNVTVGGDGFVEGEAEATATGTITNVGTATNTIQITTHDGFLADNYDITSTPGTLEITPKSITDPTLKFEGTADTYYNGKDQTEPVTVTDSQTNETLEEGVDYDIKYSDDTTNAGDVTVTITGKGNYEGTNTLKYTIQPRPILLTVKGATKVYDGTELTCDEWETEGRDALEGEEGLVNGETIGVEILGSQLYVGSSPNGDVNVTWAEGETSHFTKSFLLGLLRASYTAQKANYDLEVEMEDLVVTDEGVDLDLVLTKSHDEGTYAVGDVVTFTLTATNIYDETRTITFEELEGVEVEQAVFEEVEPGETVTTTATYTITEDDIVNGGYTNEVNVTIGDDAYGPVADDVEVEPMDATLTLTKTVTSNVPAEGVSAGDKISYEITATNDGNVTLYNITVTDELTGDEWTIDELAPGESETFTCEYTVTEADAKAGSVKNVATATALDPTEEEIEVTPAEVETKVAATPEPARNNTPKMGDDTNLGPAALIAGVGVSALIGGLFLRRRKEDER